MLRLQTFLIAALLCGLCFYFLFEPTPFASAGAQSHLSDVHAIPKIELDLSPLKRSYLLRRSVMVRIDLRNVGNDRIFIPSEIHTSGGFPSEVQLWWEDSQGKDLPASGGASDRFGPPREDFLKLLLENWVVLPPGYSYGCTIDATTGVELSKPGKYQVRAKYRAYEMDSKSMNNPLGAHLDKIPTLPFPAWKGEVESNAISIEIVPDPAEVN
jgi:hypothetical protein